ncbi:sphingomyelin phosphodiesterase 4 isoform X2 [Nilaparvata lugens]|uniref:sphingomyelin phosphodiesterase 4 isoform X2 n=1 Tax=Nilaparvata lugens TaxID=108931 RepID=UPI00193DD192|nr:sphingomyelin phosphodiesterase 4 isoform X2 [Nilaparvata lugens]
MLSIMNVNPLHARCEMISKYVSECTNKELESLLPVLVEEIFGISNQVGWNLRLIKFDSNAHDYDVLFKFLHPSGPVFKLCYKLLSDCHLKYEFQLSFLPAKVQQMINDGMVLPFYTDKLQYDHKTRTPISLALNPFEFYMFHFVYHLMNPNIQTSADSSQYMHWESLYLRLAEEYLNTFLPCNGSTVYPITNLYSGTSPTPRPHIPVATRPARSPMLLRQSVLLKQSPTSPTHTSSPTSPMLEIWRSELLARLCVDFWLGSFNNHSQTNSMFSQQSLPTGEHLWVVRFMVKHLHYFSNSLIEDSSAMDELKRVIIPSSQGKLYEFLKHTMQHWPLDTSFRLILETWLSYIQPWRYIDPLRKPITSDDSPMVVEPRWFPFIAENLLAYSLIFQLLLTRFSRVDLATPKNAFMLFRVTKVFAQINVIDLLREAEGSLEEGGQLRSSSKWSAVVRQHILDLEGPGFQYQSLFSAETRAELVKFQGQIQTAMITARRRLAAETENHQKGGFLSWFTMATSDFEYSIDERRKVNFHLQAALNSITSIFRLEASEAPTSCVNDSFFDTTPTNNCSDQSVLYWKKKQKEIKYEGDPDLQPIRSFENAILVRLLYQIALWINLTYRGEIGRLYYRQDCLGGVARQMLEGPRVIRTYDKSGPLGYSPRISYSLPPRLSLRLLAHHRTLLVLVLVYSVARLCSYPATLVFLVLLFAWLAVLLCRHFVGYSPPCAGELDVSFNDSY